MNSDAMLDACAATNPGKPESYHRLGQAPVLKRRYAEAIPRFGIAADHGYATALNDSGIPYRDGNGMLENRAEALRLRDGTACKDDPWSHMRLADLSERAGSSLDSALLHHAMAASLFTDLHVSDEAASETARRGSLARNMPKQEVIRLWRQVLTWRQTRSACQGHIQ
jgi:hypothetical protein